MENARVGFKDGFKMKLVYCHKKHYTTQIVEFNSKIDN